MLSLSCGWLRSCCVIIWKGIFRGLWELFWKSWWNTTGYMLSCKMFVKVAKYCIILQRLVKEVSNNWSFIWVLLRRWHSHNLCIKKTCFINGLLYILIRYHYSWIFYQLNLLRRSKNQIIQNFYHVIIHNKALDYLHFILALK